MPPPPPLGRGRPRPKARSRRLEVAPPAACPAASSPRSLRAGLLTGVLSAAAAALPFARGRSRPKMVSLRNDDGPPRASPPSGSSPSLARAAACDLDGAGCTEAAAVPPPPPLGRGLIRPNARSRRLEVATPAACPAASSPRNLRAGLLAGLLSATAVPPFARRRSRPKIISLRSDDAPARAASPPSSSSPSLARTPACALGGAGCTEAAVAAPPVGRGRMRPNASSRRLEVAKPAACPAAPCSPTIERFRMFPMVVLPGRAKSSQREDEATLRRAFSPAGPKSSRSDAAAAISVIRAGKDMRRRHIAARHTARPHRRSSKSSSNNRSCHN